VEDQEQRVERLDSKVEKLEEADVEAHKLDKVEPRHELGRHELGETEEPDVEAHRLEKFEGRHEA
jgi:hypothetical protein